MIKHRFNFFDITIIAVMVLMLFIHSYVFQSSRMDNGKVTYTLTAEKTSSHTSELFKEGNSIYNKNGIYIGKITAVNVSEKTDEVENIEGKRKQVEYSDVYTVKITVEATAFANEQSITVNNEKIATGRTVVFTSNGATAEGICTDVLFEYFDGENSNE